MTATHPDATIDADNRQVAHCACGKSWRQFDWVRLKYRGRMDSGESWHLELRDCVCGSTLSARFQYLPYEVEP